VCWLRSSLNNPHEFPILTIPVIPSADEGAAFKALVDTRIKSRFLAAARNDDIAGLALRPWNYAAYF
jgi:hypothetical protein